MSSLYVVRKVRDISYLLIAFLFACLPACLLVCLLAYLFACLSTSCLLACLLTCCLLLVYLLACIGVLFYISTTQPNIYKLQGSELCNREIAQPQLNQ